MRNLEITPPGKVDPRAAENGIQQFPYFGIVNDNDSPLIEGDAAMKSPCFRTIEEARDHLLNIQGCGKIMRWFGPNYDRDGVIGEEVN